MAVNSYSTGIPDEDATTERRHVFLAGLLTLLTLAVLISPVLRRPVRDSFPLSTFPMFSSLIEPEVTIDYVVGIDGNGLDIRLSPEVIAGTDEVIIAGSIVTQAVRGGQSSASALCNETAGRVHQTAVVVVEVRSDTVDAIEWFSGGPSVLATIIHATCHVG